MAKGEAKVAEANSQKRRFEGKLREEENQVKRMQDQARQVNNQIIDLRNEETNEAPVDIAALEDDLQEKSDEIGKIDGEIQFYLNCKFLG